MQFTVGKKLALSFGLTLAFLVAVAGFGAYRMRGIEAAVEDIVEVNNQQVRYAYAMRMAMAQLASSVRGVLLARTPDQRAAERERIDIARDNYGAAMKGLEAMFASREKTDEQRDALARAKDLIGKVKPLNDRVLGLAAEGRQDEAAELYSKEAEAATDSLLQTIRELSVLADKHTDQDLAQVKAAYRASLLQMAALALCALATATLLGIRLTRGLIRQLGGEPNYAAEVANRIAGGDLATPVALRRGDTTSLLHAMTKMQASLATLVEGIRLGAHEIASGSSQIASGNADLSQRTEEQASSLEETAATMQQLMQTVASSADAARQAEALASGATRQAEDGSAAVAQVRTTMDDIESASQQIGNIIGVIDGIAFQTNILALNAAVEAARAGEQGRGFAVVASEVRSLARRCADAAREVKALIHNSSERVARGGGQVSAATARMADIVESVAKVQQLLGEMATASAEQREGINQVGVAVENLDTVTQQNAALVEESASAAESLRQQAERLVQGVSVFRTAA